MSMPTQGVVSRCCPIFGVSLRCNRGVSIHCPVVVSRTVLWVFTSSFLYQMLGGGRPHVIGDS